ncbi:voltage-gated potassium channel [Halovenus aranensis]|jgi:voltage-gated potassium channel|uniref:Voltage-gated potassium channel n=1 Tax=Halovenus aranensis TaxID=890420 RepID=A0A1G8TDU0_9EURY|nr:NAD-binding protein [Halovenus aranensis]SDJ39678.1 voltage-gated potassium channel [Halovenus aranensis]
MADSTRRIHRLVGVRAAVTLAVSSALLSLATGLANITTGVVVGPLSSYIPEIVQQTAGFTGTLTGFVLLLFSRQLYRRLRVGWYGTVVLLPVAAIQGIVQASVYSLPLVILSLLALPIVAVNYSRFDRPITFSNAQIAAVLALVGTLAYGTVGSFTLREEFVEIESVTDAFYYTIVTASTVGYGDITPTSEEATLFSVSLVVLGTVSFAVALGSVLGPALEARFERALGTMTETEYDLLEDHIVVLGYGELTEPLLEELSDVRFVVVTDDAEQARRLRERDVGVHIGNPSDQEPLESVAIDRARAVIVATNNDAEDALAILTARELNPAARIVAGATSRDNVDKLRRAGADTVLSPAVIGGQLLVRSALSGEDVEGLTETLLDEG